MSIKVDEDSLIKCQIERSRSVESLKEVIYIYTAAININPAAIFQLIDQMIFPDLLLELDPFVNLFV